MTQAAGVTRQFQGVADSSSRSVRTLDRSFNNLNNSMSTPLQKLRDYVLVLGNIRLAILNVRDIAVGWVGSLLMQSAQVERLTMLMKGLSQATTEVGKSREAQQNLQMLFSEARRTGFAVDALADSFVKMKSGGIDPTTGGLQSLTNAVATFGGNSDIMHRASIAIQQMAGKGVISMEELRQQLGEAVPSAMADMARAMGMSVKQFTDLVGKGVVQAKPALQLLFNEWEILYKGAGERMAGTLTGQMAQFKTNMMELATVFTGLDTATGQGKPGSLFDEAKSSLEKLNEAMRSNEGKKFVQDLGQNIAAIAKALTEVGGFIIKFRDEIGIAMKAIVGYFVLVKSANFFAWMIGGINQARVAMTAAATGAAAMSNPISQTLQNWTDGLKRVHAEQQNGVALANGRLQLANKERMVAAEKAVQMNGEVSRLKALGRDYAHNTVILDRHRKASEEALRVGRETGRYRDFETKQFITQSQAIQNNSNVIKAQTRNRVAAAANAKALTAAEAGLRTAFDQQTAAAARATVAERANTMGKRALAAAAGVAAAATRGLAIAVNLALGPLGLIAIALLSAAQAAGVFENRANRAAEAAKRLRQGIADIEAMETLNERNQQLVAQQKVDRDRISAGGTWQTRKTSDGYERVFVRDSDETRRGIVDRMQGRAKEAKANARDWRLGAGSVARENGTEAANLAQRQMDESLQGRRTAYERAKADPKTSTAELDRLRAEFQSAQQAKAQAGLDEIQKLRAAASDAGDTIKVQMYDQMAETWRANNNMTDELTLSTEELREAAVGAGEAQKKGMSAAEKAAKKADDAFKRARDRYANMLGNQDGQIAEMEAELIQLQDTTADTSTEYAGFQARVKAGLYSDATQQELDDLAKGFKRIDELNQDLDWESGLRRLRKEIAKTRMEADGMWQALLADNTGRAFEEFNRLETVRSQYADRIAAAGSDPEKIAQINAEIDSLVTNLDRIDAAAAVDNWRVMTEEIQISLMDENEARQANFDREMERQRLILQTILDNAEISADAKIAAEQRFEQWKIAAQQRLDRDNESSTTRMARDWAKLGQNIDQALGGALNNFVDGMFDAEFNFGKFAKSLIKDIIKIIIKAMIAYAIMSALGMTHNAAGGQVSFGSFLKGQIGAGFGGAQDPSTQIGHRAPTGHTGAIIGKTFTNLATVNPSVFAGAKRYHTGTSNIGGRPLRSGEVPFIGLKGEAVLTEEHQRKINGALAAKGGAGGGDAPPVTVNFINNSKGDLTAEAGEPEFDGRSWVVGIVVEEAGKEGPLREALQNSGKN